MLALVPGGAGVLANAGDDEHELGRDAGGDYGDEEDQGGPDPAHNAGDRTDEHEPKAGEQHLQPPEHRHGEDQPVEDLDDRWRDETFPLKQVAKFEHIALLLPPSPRRFVWYVTSGNQTVYAQICTP